MSTVKNVKKSSTAIVLTPALLTLASELAIGLHSDNMNMSLAQDSHVKTFEGLADTLLMALQPNPDIAIDYHAFKNVKAKVIDIFTTAKDAKGFGYKQSTADKLWSDFTIWLTANRDFEKPKAPSKSAISNAKVSAELALIADKDLAPMMLASAKSEDYPRAQALRKEIVKRQKVQIQKIKREEGKETTALKNTLKKWISTLDVNQVSALAWLKANPKSFAEIVQTANKK
jgi:hypothetical protein